jgi:hypothetical protein
MNDKDHEQDTKRLIIAIVMALLFVGIWLLASWLGYIEFRDTNKVSNFLVMTSALWIAEVFLTGLAGSKYTFSEHGLHLTMLSFVSLITLLATSNLTGHSIPDLGAAFAVTFLLMAFALYLAVKKRHPLNGMPWRFRALSLVAGIVAAEVYILFWLSPEIVKWSY